MHTPVSCRHILNTYPAIPLVVAEASLLMNVPDKSGGIVTVPRVLDGLRSTVRGARRVRCYRNVDLSMI